jgi:hypothetical protein
MDIPMPRSSLPQFPHDAIDRPAAPGEARLVLVADEPAGVVCAREADWQFRSLSRRFDILNGSVYRRIDDAVCAARGVAALQCGACTCRRDPFGHRAAFLRELESVIDRDAA